MKKLIGLFIITFLVCISCASKAPGEKKKGAVDSHTYSFNITNNSEQILTALIYNQNIQTTEYPRRPVKVFKLAPKSSKVYEYTVDIELYLADAIQFGFIAENFYPYIGRANFYEETQIIIDEECQAHAYYKGTKYDPKLVNYTFPGKVVRYESYEDYRMKMYDYNRDHSIKFIEHKFDSTQTQVITINWIDDFTKEGILKLIEAEKERGYEVTQYFICSDPRAGYRDVSELK